MHNEINTAEEQISELENQRKEAVQKVAGRMEEHLEERFRNTEKEIEW